MVTEFISPAVVPWRCRVCDPTVVSARNPALRRVVYDNTAKKISNIEQYYFHLPPSTTNKKPQWMEEYTFKNYGVQYLDPQSMHNVLQDFKTFGSNLFHDYYRRNTVNVTGDLYIPCGCICKERQLCALEFVDYDANAKCIKENFVTCGAAGLLVPVLLIIVALVSNSFTRF